MHLKVSVAILSQPQCVKGFHCGISHSLPVITEHNFRIIDIQGVQCKYDIQDG